MFVILSKEGFYWQKGKNGNPQWVKQITTLCLHDSEVDAASTLEYVVNRGPIAEFDSLKGSGGRVAAVKVMVV